MGNYLPKCLENCSTDDLMGALQEMGPSYAVYSKAVHEHGVSGAALAQYRPSSQYEELCDTLQIQNRLHRIVLMAKLKNPTRHIEDEDSPEALVDFLNDMGPDYFRYTQPIQDHCLCMDVLGKLKLEQWKMVFDCIGVHDILEQNILYNKIMDRHAISVRAKKRKSQQQETETATCTDSTQLEATAITANKAIKTRQSSHYNASPSTRRSARPPSSSETVRT